LQNSFVSSKKLILTAMFLASISFASQASKTNETNEKINLVEPSESIEIITVVGSQPLKVLKLRFQQAEEDFFGALNALAFEESYKIECRQKKKTHSRIQRRVCEPKYVDMINYQMTNFTLTSQGGLLEDRIERVPSTLVIEKAVTAKHKDHLVKVRETVENSSELQAKLLYLTKAKRALEIKKMEVFGENAASMEIIKSIDSITRAEESVEYTK
jgi:hypothetical protein